MSNNSDMSRIANLKSYDLESEYPKEELKSITKLASEICNTPISLINIIEEFSQRTIATTHEDLNDKVIPREKSICDRTIIEGKLLIINDIEKHQKISSRLSSEDKKKIKFYAGSPLKSPEGYNLGALCVIDSKPRELTEYQKESLHTLAKEVMSRLELYRQTRLLKKKNETLKKYSLFLNNSADILCIIDSKTHLIIDINDDCHKELGYLKEELMHREFIDIIGSDIDFQKSISSWFHCEGEKNEKLTIPMKLKNKRGKEKWYRCNFTTEDNQWYLTARNIHDKKIAEDRLKALVSKFDRLVQASTDLIYELDWSTSKLTWSGRLTEILGYPNSDINVNLDWWKEKVHPHDVDELMSEIYNVASGDAITWSSTYRFRTFNGSYKYILNNSHIERDSDGTPKHVIGALSDITQIKKAELKQKTLVSKLQHANHLAGLGFWEIDLENETIDVEEDMVHILGLSKVPVNPTLKLVLNCLDKTAKHQFLDFIENIKKGNSSIEHEHYIKPPDSNSKYLIHRGELIFENGEPKKILIATQDITERKHKELRISKSLQEKEILLSEVHHRVKNNLAIISGILEMNLFQINDKSTIDFIKDSQLRIKSMAGIHEKLYQSDSFTHIPFKEYSHELIETIQNSMSSTDFEPEIKTKIESTELNLNYAIPCGLILNELITNSWKHAFPNRKTGTITISFYSVGKKMHLSVEDDGVGLPDGFKYDKASSLGMTLINILSQQLKAQLSIGNTNNGFMCKLTFHQEENRKGASSSFISH